MKSGKLSSTDFEDVVLKHLGKTRPEVLVHAGLGEDCSVIEFGNEVLVVSTDPITGASGNIGRLAVIVSCNDIASSGAEPIGILVTIMAPEGTGREHIRDVMAEIDAEARNQGIEVIGGHTEVTAAVNRLIINATVIGKSAKGSFIASTTSRPGDTIVVTKAAGLEGTSILAQDRYEALVELLPVDLVRRAQRFIDELSVVRDGLTAARGNVTAMHDATEGGLLGALCEMMEAAGNGFELDARAVPVREETREICRVARIDPLRLISSGSMVITTPEPQDILTRLNRAGIEATVVGRVTKKGPGIVRLDNNTITEVIPPIKDHLYLGLENLEHGRSSSWPESTEKLI